MVFKFLDFVVNDYDHSSNKDFLGDEPNLNEVKL
jgi:hypothetical protein